MRLIITRPRDDAVPLTRKLEARGHTPVIASLLRIEPRKNAEVPDRRYQAICISSANALVQPKIFEKLLHLPIYCVGPQSAEAAQQAGFSDPRARGGNVERMAEAMCRELRTKSGPLLYISGSETSGDLEGTLSALGFDIDRIIAYDAVPIPLQLSKDDLLSANGVVLYSPRSARLWVDAVGGAGETLLHFCLSQNVARNLPQHWPIRVADHADEDHMLSLLDQAREAE